MIDDHFRVTFFIFTEKKYYDHDDVTLSVSPKTSK